MELALPLAQQMRALGWGRCHGGAAPKSPQQWPGLEPCSDPGSARSSSPVGRLVLAWVGGDNVETWISQKLVDGRDVGPYPGPMRVDVVGDEPGMVRRPDERRVRHVQTGLTRPLISRAPVAEVGQ